MTDHELEKLIEDRLRQTFSPEFLAVINESDAHYGHAGHKAGGRHFKINMSAKALDDLSRVEAHRAVYALFQDLMPMPLHALKIAITKTNAGKL